MAGLGKYCTGRYGRIGVYMVKQCYQGLPATIRVNKKKELPPERKWFAVLMYLPLGDL